jgi:hypothetical protein
MSQARVTARVSAFVQVARIMGSLALALASCAPPLQSGGVELRDGAAARLGFFCRYRGVDPFCARPASAERAVPAAEARAWEPGSDVVGGARVEARAGDFVLANGAIAVVVGGATRTREGGAGALLDAVDAAVGVDELGHIAPSLGPGHDVEVDAVSPGHDPRSGRAWIDVRARDRASGVVLRTRYALDPAARAVSIESFAERDATIDVPGAEPPAAPTLEDDVAWGDAAPLAIEGARVAVGRSTSYALMPLGAEGELTRARAVRVFAVGARGDALAIATELDALAGVALGAVSLTFVGPGGAPVRAPSGVRLAFEALGEPSADARRPRWFRVVDSAAPVEAEIAPGCYRVSLEAETPLATRPLALRVEPGAVTRGSIVLVGDEAPGSAADAAVSSTCDAAGN